MNINVLCVYIVGLLGFVNGLVNSNINELQYAENSLLNLGSLFPFGGSRPSNRVYNSISCCAGDHAFVYGGYASDGSILNDLHVYDSRYHSWSGPILAVECCNDQSQGMEVTGSVSATNIKIPFARPGMQGDIPLGRAEHGACIVNNDLYVFGGVTMLYGIIGDFYRFDMQSLRWSKINTERNFAPVRRAGHSMLTYSRSDVSVDGIAIVEERVVVFGGRGFIRGINSPVALYDVWEYSAFDNSWRQLSAVKFFEESEHPAGRQHAATTIVGSVLYLVGGMDPNSNLTYSDVWVFYLEVGLWKVLIPNSVPTSLAGFAPSALHSAFLFPAHPTFSKSLSDSDGQDDGSIRTNSNVQIGDLAPSQGPYVVSLMLYGGTGGGGSCGGKVCGALETVLGQVYRLEFYQGSYIEPLSVTSPAGGPFGGYRRQFTYVTNATWQYARLTSASSSRGRRTKTYAYESVAYDKTKHQLFELGGIISTESGQQYLDTAAVPEPYVRDVGGMQRNELWNEATGEALRTTTKLPTNLTPWDYSDAFTIALPPTVSKIANFIPNFCIYHVGPADIVLLEPQDHEIFVL